MQVVLPNNFTPRPYQARPMKYFDEGGRRAITVWHRRAGKDLTALHQTAKSAHVDIGPYWHFFPTFTQARRAIWEGFTRDGQRILEQVFPGFLEPSREGSIVKRSNEQQMFIELKCGSIWRLMGTDQTEFVGAGPKGVVFSEFALCRPGAWDFVRPMLRESGGWAWFITTPRGRNHAKKLYDAATSSTGWFRDVQTVRDTGLTYASNKSDAQLSPEEMIEEERAEGMAEEMIDQEYFCDFNAANVGAIFGKLMAELDAQGRTDVAFEHPLDGVHTTWDLGISDAMAVWFWRRNANGIDVIDYEEGRGRPVGHYLNVVKGKPYRYVSHWLPHDARARTLVTGTSVHEEAVEQLHGFGTVHITPSMSVSDGHNAGRKLLLMPGTRFHKRCNERPDAQGVEALRQYAYAWDEEKKIFTKQPMHNWASHAGDAWRYTGVVHNVAYALEPKKEEKPKPEVKPLSLSMTLDELWEANRPTRGGRL